MGDESTINKGKDKRKLKSKVSQDLSESEQPDFTTSDEASGNSVRVSTKCIEQNLFSTRSDRNDAETNSQHPCARHQMKKDGTGIGVGNHEDNDTDDKSTCSETSESSYSTLNEKCLQELKIGKQEDIDCQNSPDSSQQNASCLIPDLSNSTSEASENISKLKSIETVEKDEKENGIECERKHKRPKVPVACTDDKGDEDHAASKVDEPSETNDVDDDEIYDPTPHTPKPKHKWFICKEAIARQYGTSNYYSNDLFRLQCGGSLHMVERLELMYMMNNHNGCVNSLHFNSTGTRLASGSDDLSVVIWDWTASEAILKYKSGHKSNVFQAKFMPLSGDSHLVSCSRDGQVRLAELSATGVCKETRKLAQHKDAAHKLALETNTPHTFLSCGEDSAVFQIDLREEKPKSLVECKENDKKVPLYTVFSNPMNSYEFGIGGTDHFVRIYDKRNIREDIPMKKFSPRHLIDSDLHANVTCLVYNYNGSEILATYNDEDIYIFDTSQSDGAEYIHRYQGHRNSETVKGVNYFGLKSEFIVSGSDCGYIYFWEKESEHIVQCLLGDEGGVVNCLEPHPNCPVMATSGLDIDVKIWVPSCEHPPDLSGLKSKISKNLKERDYDRKHDDSDTYDSEMLWFLMQHFRRTPRRRERVENLGDSHPSSSNEESDDEDTDPQNPIQCTQT
ncbi:DDB1- and CUL4-associated factor 8-like [Limulus polyphemus]|uniref:DDB1- and CUL4-associated factor 8-like n=1 Tax=Limulus polyphemus TaxID=6850 RepID=A0ABM1BB55_LIMPO|nr:DDB1- and CUL4-associated factor 8-like [Limulus polyphemus]XP_013778467.1 DDB1- and CUL4-associated factor 8-like [Limulus polyphemus]